MEFRPEHGLKFTPLEFETLKIGNDVFEIGVKIYSVGV